jgi:hypothetical protein
MPAPQEPPVDMPPVRRFRDPSIQPQAATLGELRKKIDGLDQQIVDLLVAARTACVTRPASSAIRSRSRRRSARRRCSPACASWPQRMPDNSRRCPTSSKAAYRVLVAGFIASEERYFAETEPIDA